MKAIPPEPAPQGPQENPPNVESPDILADPTEASDELPDEVSATQPDQRHSGSLLKRVEKNERVLLVIFTALIAVFTVVLALSTFFLWRSTENLVHGAEDTAQRQLRAYVSVVAVQLYQFGTEKPVIGGLEIVNNGQTPAYKITATINVGTGLTKSAAPRGPLALDPKAKIYLWGATESPLTQDDYDAVVRSAASIFVYGEIRYVDAFGKNHFSRFRYTYGGDGVAPTPGTSLTVSPSQEGNESD